MVLLPREPFTRSFLPKGSGISRAVPSRSVLRCGHQCVNQFRRVECMYSTSESRDKDPLNNANMLSNVEFHLADLRHGTPFEDKSFDLVHIRSMLLVVSIFYCVLNQVHPQLLLLTDSLSGPSRRSHSYTASRRSTPQCRMGSICHARCS
jgi:hypothetical protein